MGGNGGQGGQGGQSRVSPPIAAGAQSLVAPAGFIRCRGSLIALKSAATVSSQCGARLGGGAHRDMRWPAGPSGLLWLEKTLKKLHMYCRTCQEGGGRSAGCSIGLGTCPASAAAAAPPCMVCAWRGHNVCALQSRFQHFWTCIRHVCGVGKAVRRVDTVDGNAGEAAVSMASKCPPPRPLGKVHLATAICARWQAFPQYLTFRHMLWGSLCVLWNHDCRPDGAQRAIRGCHRSGGACLSHDQPSHGEPLSLPYSQSITSHI